MTKNLKIGSAVAAVLALGAAAAPASAAVIEPYNLTGAEPFTLYLSGATAQDKGIILLMRRMCSAGTMTRVQGTIDSAIACEANGTDTPGIAAGTTIVLYKNSNGGSSRGVNPVADKTAVTFLNLASLTAADYANPAKCTVTNVAATPDFVDYKNYACGANVTTSNIAPDAGISDVEPSLLGWVPGVNGALTTSGGPMLTFGVPVSKNFRDALQAAQAAQLGAGCVVGSDAAECMPSLTKAQIASIYNAGITPIARLSDELGALLPNPAGGTAISVCRRKNGSGTLAGFNAYFLNVGCVKNSQAVKAMVGGTDGNAAIPSVASRVNEYSSTPQVIGCLNANHTANKYAIGMASIEFKPGTAYANTGLAGDFNTDAGNWGWVRINGQAPSLLNTAQARYDFAFELSYQVRAAGNPQGVISADKNTLYGLIVSTNSSAPVLKELNAAFQQSAGATAWDAGLLGKPGASTLPSAAPAGALTAAEVRDNPIAAWSRSLASGTANSCQPAYITRETGVDAAL